MQVNGSVAATAPGSGTPGGTITVTATNSTGCTITLPATSCNLTFTTLGAQTIDASYGGDTKFNGSTAASIAHTVNKANTTVTISDPVDPTVFGQLVQVNGSVSATAPGAGTPGGTITVTATNSTGCTITLPATSCNLAFTASGAQTINASYGGDASFNGSTASSIGHAVNKAATSLSITSDLPDPSGVGETVTVQAALAVTAPGAGAPGGSIAVTATSSTGCTITLPQTSCDLTFSASGLKSIDASYSGDANFLGSAGATAPHTVSSNPNLAVTKDDGVTNAVQGATTSYAITVSNPGSIAVAGATLADSPPAALSAVTWTCTPTPPANCANASGNGALAESVTLAPGESLSYVVTGTVGGTIGNSLSNTATITLPDNGTDADPSNNTATDIDTIVGTLLFSDGFEDPPPP